MGPWAENKIKNWTNKTGVSQIQADSWKITKRLTVYGLATALWCWFGTLVYFLNEKGFESNLRRLCLFIKHYGEDLIFVLAYVDDLLVMSPKTELINETLDSIASKFTINKSVYPEKFLSLQIKKCDSKLLLHQIQYIETILKEFCMATCNPDDTPWKVKICNSTV